MLYKSFHLTEHSTICVIPYIVNISHVLLSEAPKEDEAPAAEEDAPAEEATAEEAAPEEQAAEGEEQAEE